MGRKTADEGPLADAMEKLRKFSQDSYFLVRKCTKPDSKQFWKIATATSIGFLVMGGVGFALKVVGLGVNTYIIGD